MPAWHLLMLMEDEPKPESNIKTVADLIIVPVENRICCIRRRFKLCTSRRHCRTGYWGF